MCHHPQFKKFLNFSKLFPHLQNVGNKSTYLRGMWGRLNVIIPRKHRAQITSSTQESAPPLLCPSPPSPSRLLLTDTALSPVIWECSPFPVS